MDGITFIPNGYLSPGALTDRLIGQKNNITAAEFALLHVLIWKTAHPGSRHDSVAAERVHKLPFFKTKKEAQSCLDSLVEKGLLVTDGTSYQLSAMFGRNYERQIIKPNKIKNVTAPKSVQIKPDDVPNHITNLFSTGNKVIDAVKRFVSYRDEMGKPMTPKAVQSFVGVLNRLTEEESTKMLKDREDVAVLLIDNAISRNWLGVYPFQNGASVPNGRMAFKDI